MDISLGDIGWVIGGIVAFAAVRILFTYRADIAQVIMASRVPRASADDDYAGADTGSAKVVPGQQHQAASELVLDFEMVLDYLRRHNLTDEQLIDVYAIPHRADGDHPLSANRIREAVGGNEAAVKARVASHRPKPKPMASRRLERPANGWGPAR